VSWVVLSVLCSIVTFRWEMRGIGQDFGVIGERSPPVGVELVAHGSQPGRVELVDVPRPFLVLADQARVLKHLQVLGDRGPSHRHPGGQLTDREGLVGQSGNDRAPCSVGECPPALGISVSSH
jgi:hypothetical protein